MVEIATFYELETATSSDEFYFDETPIYETNEIFGTPMTSELPLEISKN